MTNQEKREIVLKLLSVLAVGAVVIGAATAPGILLAFAPFLSKKTGHPPRQIGRAIQYARKRQWVTVRESPGGLVMELTEWGRRRYRHLQLDRPLSGRTWDGLWRVIIFDIPEEKKTARDALRFTLKRLGLYQLQESVWMTPWPCREYVEALRDLYGIPQDVLMIEATRIENDVFLRNKFNL